MHFIHASFELGLHRRDRFAGGMAGDCVFFDLLLQGLAPCLLGSAQSGIANGAHGLSAAAIRLWPIELLT